MAQEGLQALLARIRAAAWDGDVAASRAWDALIALVLRRHATMGDGLVAPHRLVLLIEERSNEEEQFADAFQEWMSRYGTVAGSGGAPKIGSGGIRPMDDHPSTTGPDSPGSGDIHKIGPSDIRPIGDHPSTTGPDSPGTVSPRESHPERYAPGPLGARPPGPPFGDDDWGDDWGDETDENA
ncbi:MAG: hypothetical protein HOY75_30695 [Streptomyces sp.]|nr:hypothetical protein [Streptomyces sp.]